MQQKDLHSSMVRLEIHKADQGLEREPLFTFQYGQIRNKYIPEIAVNSSKFTFQYGQIRNIYYVYSISAYIYIYIPVWLDQK